MDFRFFMPTTVECGAGISSRIGLYLQSYNYKRIMLVSDPGIIKANLLIDIEASLDEYGISYERYDHVEPNPGAESIMEGVEQRKMQQADAILAVGGGSSI